MEGMKSAADRRRPPGGSETVPVAGSATSPEAPAPRRLPEAGLGELGRLAGRLLVSLLPNPLRPRSADAFGKWLGGLASRHGGPGVLLKAGPRRFVLVTEPELSRAILEPAPSRDECVAGSLKEAAMGFLADRALTVTDGEDWVRLRALNEKVLATGTLHPHARSQLAAVRTVFSEGARGVEELRTRMGEVMLRLVPGAGEPRRMVQDVRDLFGIVQSPLKRKLGGGRGRRIRERLYGDLASAYARESGDGTLLDAARKAGAALDDEDVLHQVPHWMFTFTGSGTDLLFRGLALIGSRPPWLARVLEEIREAGSLDDPESIQALACLEACLREAGRLYSPVSRTFHRSPGGVEAAGYWIPPGAEVVHPLSFLHRFGNGRADAHDFRPDRWLDRAEARPYPDVFLSGSRACPGQELILFVCKAAAATLLADGLRVHASALGRDPLPLTFPGKEARFTMNPTTTRPGEVHDARDLLELDQRQLDELFAAAPVGEIPAGKADGLAMYANRTFLGRTARKLIGWFVWKGKIFRPETGDLKNRLTPLGIPGIRASVYVDRSWKTDGNAIILDYSRTSFVASFIRDEIREVGPGLYLGKVFIGKRHMLDFSLTFR